MEKKSEISGYFHVQKFREDKRVIIFIICLSIATVLWFMNALGKDYSTVITYPVKFVNPPKNKFVTVDLPPKLELRVEARGFILLQHKLSLSFSPLVINISYITQDLTPKSGAYNIQTSGLLGNISRQIGNEINIIGIQQPEYFAIVLDSITEKWVQVLPAVQLDFRPQYKLKGKIGISPERVFIKGPAILLDTLSALYTRHRAFEKLSTDVERSVKIEYPANTEITPDRATLRINVEQSTEKELQIPVVLKNNIDSMNIKFFPPEVKVTFLVGLSEFEKINAAQFTATVDCNEINSETTYLKIKIEDKPDNIDNIRVFPETVEFLIEAD